MEVSRWNLLFWLIFISFSPLRSRGDRKVPVNLYYETLCPYCSNFIVNHLQKLFSTGLINIVDLHFVPYGNAKIGANGTIQCQHGPYECFLNTVEACAIDIWPDVQTHFSYIYCVETLVVKHEYTEWETCFTKTSTDIQRLAECYNSGHGKKLELQYEAETSALEPPHRYVPWVVVNGHPLYEMHHLRHSFSCISQTIYDNFSFRLWIKALRPRTLPLAKTNRSVRYSDRTFFYGSCSLDHLTRRPDQSVSNAAKHALARVVMRDNS